MDFPSFHQMADALSAKTNRAIEEIIKVKIEMLVARAVDSGNIQLARLLSNIRDLKTTKSDLKQAGYILEAELPETEYKFDMDFISASINPDQIKVKISKLKVLMEA